jgi:hypothetical protein
MSSIVTGILNSTVGLLWNKARDFTAAKLKDGDVTDEKVREVIMRELNDVNTKLESLSRKDLLTSYTFLQEGVDLLISSLNNSKQEAVIHDVDQGEKQPMPGDVQCELLNKALELAETMKNLNLTSDKQFHSAMERFKDGRKTATHAFCNEALSIQDRIFAAKVRIISEILECLESPETAVTGCLSFLKKLHNLPAIEQAFTVYLQGGIKSMLNKSERMKNVKSIMLINYVLFRYISKFSSKTFDVFAWPSIELSDRRFLPILHWPEVWTKQVIDDDDSGLMNQHPNGLFLAEGIYPEYSAVDSNGDVVVAGQSDNVIVITRTGERREIKLPEPKEGKIIEQYIKGLAVDSDDSVYVVRGRATHIENGNAESYELSVLDDSHNATRECTLTFLKVTDFYYSVRITIKQDNDIVLIKRDDPHVFVCDNQGKLKHKFGRNSCRLRSLTISEKNQILLSSHDLKAVHSYSEDGTVMSTIKVPDGHEVRGIAFHYLICKIIVLAEQHDSYFLHCYSKTGELEMSIHCKRVGDEYFPQIKSHPSGTFAIVRERSISFI